MMSVYDILRRPIITEKTNYQTGKWNKVTFEVAKLASKKMVKDAIELVFDDVQVGQVNIINVPPKRSRRAISRRVLVRRKGYKKAVVTLLSGTIDIFEGVK